MLQNKCGCQIHYFENLLSITRNTSGIIKYERRNMAAKYNIFVTALKHFICIHIVYRLCICTISNVIGITEKKLICIPKKEYISIHKCERANMAAKS